MAWIKLVVEEVRKQAAQAADGNGMVTVIAQFNGVTDNGHTYAQGQSFHMHKDLVPVHMQHGQVLISTEDPMQNLRIETAKAAEAAMLQQQALELQIAQEALAAQQAKLVASPSDTQATPPETKPAESPVEK